MERIRRLFERTFLSGVLGLCLLTGCTTLPPRLPPVVLQTGGAELVPEEKLSVGIEVFGPGETDADALEDQHTNAEIREAETRYIPLHLKKTLDGSGYWGEVRVVPAGAAGSDLTVRGTVLSSNGEALRIRVEVTDAQGYTWINRVYADRLDEKDYTVASPPLDPCQDIYNAIANDMAAVRRRMDARSVQELRRTTGLLFAAELLPEVYAGHVRKNPEGKREVVRLPAEDDPMWKRVERISERNRLFFNALEVSYQAFYDQIRTPYSDWRRYNLVEQVSIREARSDSFKQATAGILLIAAAVLLEVNEVQNSSTLRDVLVIAGSQVVINGINISQRADIHRETLKELSDSFGNDAKTVRVTLDGQTVTLTGTVKEQMAQWQGLLRKAHLLENEVPVEAP